MSDEFVTESRLREELLRWGAGRDNQIQDLRTEIQELSQKLAELSQRVFELNHPEDRELPAPL